MKYYRLKISHDDSPMHPIHDHDGWVGEFYAYHGNYTLGHNKGEGDSEHDLKCIWNELYPGRADKLYGSDLEEGESFPDGYDEYGDILMDKVWSDIKAKAYIAKVYMYDHSNIALSLGQFSCPWDSGTVGFVYCSLDKARKTWTGADETEDSLRTKLHESFEAHLQEYEDYVNGNCHGFQLEYLDRDNTVYELPEDGSHEPEDVEADDDSLDWVDGDSCWGFIGDPDDVCKWMFEHAPHIPQEVWDKAAYNYDEWVLYAKEAQ